MKFEDIKRVNETIITTDVKGKQYAEVNQRIKAFRMLYPEGFIDTHIINLENGVCVMKATIGYYKEHNTIAEDKQNDKYQDTYMEKIVLGTGTAYEKENSTFINKTSYIENCETSAVGRALAMCGIGIDTSIASKEEVENAINQQEQEDKKSQERMKLFAEYNKLIIETETDHEKILEHYQVSNMEEMTNEQLLDAIKVMRKKVK